MTAIGDESGAISLAGVMGGEPTGCTMETTDVFIEIALFDPVRTAATGRTFNLESDARYRFERGVDPAFAGPGMELMTRLVMELCGGEASEVVVAGAEPAWRREIALPSLPGQGARRGRLRALALPRHPHGAGLRLRGKGCRPGRGRAAALAGRHRRRGGSRGGSGCGSQVSIRSPAVSLSPTAKERARPALSPTRRRLGAMRRALTARGMFEAVTWSFMPRQHAALFGDAPDALVLANPINAELDAMRPSILPNLIEACRRNADRGFADAALFETGPVYAGTKPEDQRTHVTGVRAAAAVPRNWHGPERAVDPFDAKADALAALSAAGVSLGNLQTRAEGPAWYHPGRVGTLGLGRNVLATFGELHPGVLAELGAEGPMVGFEVMIDALPRPKAKATRAKAPLAASDYPAAERDFAFILDGGVPASEVERAARNAEKTLIKAVTVFDVYAGPGIEADKKSLAITVRLEAPDRTLTDPEIDAAAAKIVANVAKMTGGVLRG